MVGVAPDVARPKRYYRKVIRIRAEDSPNVRVGLAQEAAGVRPDNRVVLPGVLTYAEYKKRRATWDKVRQCIGLDAQFWMGPQLLMFPPDWLNRAEAICNASNRLLYGLKPLPARRQGKGMGIDPAEGGDSSVWSVVDEWGLIFQLSLKTPNTYVVPNTTLALMREYQIDSSRVVFDRGGGGLEHADTLRQKGHKGIRTVAFGESLTLDPKRGINRVDTRMEIKEERYAYTNRRAQMFGELRNLLNPDAIGDGFCIPPEYEELRRQLAPIPLTYDEEGRMYLLPKHKKDPDDDDDKTLVGLIGCSPDEADSLVLAVHGMLYKKNLPAAGAIKSKARANLDK